MSWEASSWAWKQRGLLPGERLVLMYLADCHNPRRGCFPMQETIAEECEISARSVNNHLSTLEERGLIRRQQAVDEVTRKQLPTRYVLGFEMGNPAANGAPEAVEKSGSRMQNLHTEPYAKNVKNRMQNLHTEPSNRLTRNTRTRGDAVDNGGFGGNAELAGPKPEGWAGDASIRMAIVGDPRYGEGFARSFLDTASPGLPGVIVARTRTGAERLAKCEVLQARGIRVQPPP